jgi:hypothetical protein
LGFARRNAKFGEKPSELDESRFHGSLLFDPDII